MEPISSPFWRRTLAALVRRREPRGMWLYTICAIVVVLYALITLWGIGVSAPPDQTPRLLGPALWLSLPIAVVLIQMFYQTVLGWLLVLAEFAVPALVVSYFLLQERSFEPWDLTITALFIAISIGLVWNRPRAEY